MAYLTFDVYSKALQRTVTLNAIVPLEAMKEKETLRTMILLHGVNGSYVNWLSITNISGSLARHNAAAAARGEKRLCILMPSAGNGFYRSVPHKNAAEWAKGEGYRQDYAAFFGEELISLMRRMLPLSGKKEDTMIAGLSMGGYGALMTAMQHPDTFGRCAGFSSALITRKSKEALEKSGFYGQEAFLEALYEDFDAAKQSPDADAEAAILSLAAKKDGRLPSIEFYCGTEDALLDLSRELDKDLEVNSVAHRYGEHSGGHDWVFWQWALDQTLSHWEEDFE